MGMKRITSEWDLEDFLLPGSEVSFPHVDHLAFSFDAHAHGNTINSPSIGGGALGGSQIWSHSPTSKNSGISATLESQSSIGAGSPTSSFKVRGGDNQTLGGTSDSEQSDEESQETETGPCEQSTKVADLKRMRRMVSNRESARRSRKRKQAHLADLELQVDQLRGENSSLYKQLTDANQQFSDAATDNRVLKSGVEALRVKVKMAEDLVARGSLTCSLDHLLQNHIGSTQLSSTRNLFRASEVPPIVDVQGGEDFSIDPLDVGQFHNMGVENNGLKNGSIRSRVNQGSQLQGVAGVEHLQSGADIWPWDSETDHISKAL